MKNGKHTSILKLLALRLYNIVEISNMSYNNNKSIVPDEMIMKYFKSN